MKPEELIKIAISSGYEVRRVRLTLLCSEKCGDQCDRYNSESAATGHPASGPNKRDAGIMIKRASGKREYSLYFRFLQKP